MPDCKKHPIRKAEFPNSTTVLKQPTRAENKSWNNGHNHNAPLLPALSMPQRLKLMPQSKWKVLLPNSRLLKRGRDSNVEPLVLINIIVVVAIVIASVIILMGEFCGGPWLRPLSQDLFSARVYILPLQVMWSLPPPWASLSSIMGAQYPYTDMESKIEHDKDNTMRESRESHRLVTRRNRGHYGRWLKLRVLIVEFVWFVNTGMLTGSYIYYQWCDTVGYPYQV